MTIRKLTNKYYFSVEGETEQWYLEWLRNTINATEASAYNVSFSCRVQKDPLKHAKSLVVLGKTDVYHFSDYESNEPVHVQQFRETMDRMKEANKAVKHINYKFGYSNLTFELWIILHMADCNGSVCDRSNYLRFLNSAYKERFNGMNEYKHETNFKRCLGKLQLSNVIDAVKRAKTIMQTNRENCGPPHQYKGYEYYKDNPSLTIWEAIEKILKDCKLC